MHISMHVSLDEYMYGFKRPDKENSQTGSRKQDTIYLLYEKFRFHDSLLISHHLHNIFSSIHIYSDVWHSPTFLAICGCSWPFRLLLVLLCLGGGGNLSPRFASHLLPYPRSGGGDCCCFIDNRSNPLCLAPPKPTERSDPVAYGARTATYKDKLSLQTIHFK